jgi:hypothetical protein
MEILKLEEFDITMKSLKIPKDRQLCGHKKKNKRQTIICKKQRLNNTNHTKYRVTYGTPEG